MLLRSVPSPIRLEPCAKKASYWGRVVTLSGRKPRSRVSIVRMGRLPLATRRGARKYDLGILDALFLDQGIQDSRIFWRDARAAMRHGFAESLHFIAAVDGMAILHEEN